MRYKLFVVVLILNIIFIGCSKSNNLDDILVDNTFKYSGTWIVESYSSISEDEYNEAEDLTGKEVQIKKDSIKIFNSLVANVRYKLKVVDKSYVISYENNITAERFMRSKDRVDIISAIDNNITLCEFIILDDDNIVMIYRSDLIYLKKISSDTNFTVNNGNIINDNSIDDSNNSDVGVMIGLKKPRMLNEDGSYTGVVKNNVIKISQNNNNIIVRSYGEDNIEELFNFYFDMNTDYEKIKIKLRVL